MDIAELLMNKSKSYFDSQEDLVGQVPSPMLVDFVIEKWKDKRNYPTSFSEERVFDDMKKHLSTLAMAVLDLYVKTGFEGQVSSSESGISRVFENAYISNSIFVDVLPFVDIL